MLHTYMPQFSNSRAPDKIQLLKHITCMLCLGCMGQYLFDSLTSVLKPSTSLISMREPIFYQNFYGAIRIDTVRIFSILVIWISCQNLIFPLSSQYLMEDMTLGLKPDLTDCRSLLSIEHNHLNEIHLLSFFLASIFVLYIIQT